MTTVWTKTHKAPKPKDPIFIEGLPGVGNVGKLACDHLVDVLDAKPWIDIFSRDFPPQVTIGEDGTIDLVHARLWVAPGAAAGGKQDVVLMTGEFQPMSPQGQHDMVGAILDELEAVGCDTMFTTGGYGLGTTVEDPGVLGAAIDTKMVKRLEKLDVRFEEDEPGAGIIGASGLFLGLGKMRGFTGACLMGETSGFLVDPKAARAVLRVLADIAKIPDIDDAALEDKAAELDRIAGQLSAAESGRADHGDLHYIG